MKLNSLSVGQRLALSGAIVIIGHRPSGPPTQWPPTETHDVHAARRPCESLALTAPGDTLAIRSWLHPLRGWSLRETPGGPINFKGTRSSHRHGLKSFHLNQFIVQLGLRLPQVKLGLHVQPELSAIAKQRSQTKRHLG